MTTIETTLQIAAADLNAIGARWALIGGMAVGYRTEPRFTKDVDFAVAVADDAEADSVVFRLRSRGYLPGQIFEQNYLGQASTVRLTSARSHVIVDLLFACSGIEQEIVAAAETGEVLPRVRVPVATTGHLIAMKALAGRHRDLNDLESLIPAASPADLAQAREGARLIKERGFSREHDVVASLEYYIAEAGR
jgi:hypothetical protein